MNAEAERFPDSIVFDTEPLVAYADGEPGSSAVAGYLDAVLDAESDGAVSSVNATEVRYVIARKYDRDTADTFLRWLRAVGVDIVSAAPVWEAAADRILDHNPALGDAYALATATERDATLLVGADDDYDGVTDVAIERFRDEGA